MAKDINAPTNERLVLIIIPNHWAKAQTIAEAWDNLRKITGHNLQSLRRGGFHIYCVHPASYCEPINGGIVHPIDCPPTKIESGPQVPKKKPAAKKAPTTRPVSTALS